MALELRNFVKGTVRTLQASITDPSSSKLTLNLDSDKELGSLISRKGTSLVGSQLIASRSCLGIGNFRDTAGSSHKLFAAFPDGTNTDIYDVEAGTKSLEDDTKDLKTYFCQYLGAMIRTNGTDSPKYYNGTSWISSPTGTNFTAAVTDIITSAGHGLLDGDVITFTTTDTLPAGLSLLANYYVRDKTTDTFKVSLTKGGSAVDITDTGTGTHTWAYWDPFDISNVPSGLNYPLEWKDKVYGAVGSILYHSTVADPDTLTINWTGTTAGQNQIEQEDNGGDITALAKIPGYLLIFKERSLKRYDGAQTYPDDMIRQGVPCQEAVCVAKGMAGFLNHKGIWLTNGGYPQRISKNVQDFVDAIPQANLTSVSSWADDEYMCWSIGDVTVDERDYTNVVLKYNVDYQTWDIYSYHNSFQQFARYIDTSSNDVIVGGDADGHILQVNSGYSDFEDDGVKPIEWIHETPDLEFGSRGNIKEIKRMLVYSKNISTGRVMKRVNSSRPQDWKEIEHGRINEEVQELESLKIEGNWINIKTTGTTNTTQAKILGYEFPEDNIKQSRNADQ